MRPALTSCGTVSVVLHGATHRRRCSHTFPVKPVIDRQPDEEDNIPIMCPGYPLIQYLSQLMTASIKQHCVYRINNKKKPACPPLPIVPTVAHIQ
jgi:hypothetical protein